MSSILFPLSHALSALLSAFYLPGISTYPLCLIRRQAAPYAPCTHTLSACTNSPGNLCIREALIVKPQPHLCVPADTPPSGLWLDFFKRAWFGAFHGAFGSRWANEGPGTASVNEKVAGVLLSCSIDTAGIDTSFAWVGHLLPLLQHNFLWEFRHFPPKQNGPNKWEKLHFPGNIRFPVYRIIDASVHPHSQDVLAVFRRFFFCVLPPIRGQWHPLLYINPRDEASRRKQRLFSSIP